MTRLVEAAIAQLELLIEDPTMGAVVRTDVHPDAGTDAAFARAVSAAVEGHARPALAAYRDMLQASVLPYARDDEHPGLCHLPDGEDMYRALARLHTSMSSTPEELHEMGCAIVDQVMEEMIGTGSDLFGTTDIFEIFERLNHTSLRYRSREEMLEHAQRVVAAAEAEAPKWFATVPDVACTVAAVPEAEEAGMGSAYYMPGAIDGSRPGTYYLNTSQPENRHRYVAEDIAFHEAVPGHHFQLTIAMESNNLAPARQVLATRPAPRAGASTASGWPTKWVSTPTTWPAWASSPPTRGGPAGSWSTPACTPWGGHDGAPSTGWRTTRHSPRLEVETEIDRYISFPGQALAYMVGRREIVRLRAEATERLGQRFDLREFHDLVLRAGILPLPALGRTVERWIERQSP